MNGESRIGSLDLDRLWTEVDEAGPRESAGTDLALDPDWSERLHSQSDRRRSFIASYSWGVPTREAIAAISAHFGDRQVLEVCAGRGLWALLLEATGSRVLATDGSEPVQPFVPVGCLDAEAAVRDHPECAGLLLVWPPFRDDAAFRALRAFQGDRVAFVGDERFTADLPFRHTLNEEWNLDEQILIPSWPGLDDQVYLYTRGA